MRIRSDEVVRDSICQRFRPPLEQQKLLWGKRRLTIAALKAELRRRTAR